LAPKKAARLDPGRMAPGLAGLRVGAFWEPGDPAFDIIAGASLAGQPPRSSLGATINPGDPILMSKRRGQRLERSTEPPPPIATREALADCWGFRPVGYGLPHPPRWTSPIREGIIKDCASGNPDIVVGNSRPTIATAIETARSPMRRVPTAGRGYHFDRWSRWGGFPVPLSGSGAGTALAARLTL
jgi:hypothetical protein